MSHLNVELCEIDASVIMGRWEMCPTYYFAVDVTVDDLNVGDAELNDALQTAIEKSGEQMPDAPTFEFGKVIDSDACGGLWVEVRVS